MNTQLKKSYRERLKDFFYRIKIHPWHQKLMMLPFWVKALIAVFLFLFGIVGLLTPVPAGWIMILSAFVLIFGLHIVRRNSMKIFFLLRIHHLIEWIKLKTKK